MKAETFTPKPTVYCDPRANRLYGILYFVTVGLMLSNVFLGLYRVLQGDSKPPLPLWLLAVALFYQPSIGYLLTRLFPSYSAPARDDMFLRRVKEILAAAGYRVWRVEINERGTEPQAAELFLSAGTLTVSREAIKTLAGDSLDFGIAEAVTRKLLRPFAIPVIGLFASLGLTIPLRIFLLRYYSSLDLAFWLVWADLVLVAIFGIVLFFVFRREDEKRVRQALQLVPNRESAIGWVENSIPYGRGIDTQDQLDAYRAKQLMLINKVADEMGLP